MPRYVPWLLVALCFALGVASRSISDTFAVFVPALESAFGSSRSSVTVVYSFALLAGGTGAPLAGWIVDRFGLRALTVVGMSAAALATLSASQASHLWHLYLGLGIVMGILSALLSGASYGTELGNMVDGPRAGHDGHLFGAIDIAAFQPVAAFKARVDAVIRQIRESGRRADVDRLYPPGLLEAEFEQRYAIEGIPLNDETIAGIRGAARRVGIIADVLA